MLVSTLFIDIGDIYWGQFYFTGTGSAIFDNCRKLSRKCEIKLTE